MNDETINDLFAAVRAGNSEEVREILVSSPESATARDSEGATALRYAAEIAHRTIVALLLDAGADINARDEHFHATPAGWAIEYLRERGPCSASRSKTPRMPSPAATRIGSSDT